MVHMPFYYYALNMIYYFMIQVAFMNIEETMPNSINIDVSSPNVAIPVILNEEVTHFL